VLFEHETFSNVTHHEYDWAYFSGAALNCKLVISAKAGLNGKIILKILDTDDISLTVYLMPNAFNEEYGTHGILENNKVYTSIVSGTYVVPTDWTIYLIYSHNPAYDGKIKIKSWIEKYTRHDIWNITNEWQPTGTSYIRTL